MATLIRHSAWLFVLTGLCAAGGLVEHRALAADWPQFLGPNRNGISDETGLLNEWPAGGPKEVWRAPGGVGMSAVVISGGMACTLAQADEQQILLALDAKTGQQKWRTTIVPEFRNQMGNGPRATPAIADGAAFVFTGDGTLARVELASGDLTWKVPTFGRFPGKVADYGMACSPVVWGDTVIVTIGAAGATVAAFDVKSGETRWEFGKQEPAGYSSPAVLSVGGREQLVAFTGASVYGLSKTGQRLWFYPYVTDYDCNIATPLLVDGKVFVSAGENHGSTLLSLIAVADRYRPSVAWESVGTGSVLRNEWQTSIYMNGYIYGFDNVGSAGPVTHLTCVNPRTGKVAWQEARFGKGNLIAADGKLFMSTMKGELVVAKASPAGYQEIGRQQVIETTRQAPSLSNGLLYLRDDAEIVCLNIKR
jgi:outer membrane protein assembly factor BamB